MNDKYQLLSGKQAAALLNINIRTLRRWPGLTIIRTPGGHRRYRRDEIVDVCQGSK